MILRQCDKTAVAAILGHDALVTVGGSMRDLFVPNINVSFRRKVKDEFFLNVNAADQPGTLDPVIGPVAGQDVGLRADSFFVESDGTLEHHMVLRQPPESPVITLQVKCSPVLEFLHQPELTPAEIADGYQRPDDIINSYAVYCDKANNVYQTGKVCHVKRSWVETAGGLRLWCEQSISVENGRGTWTITLPGAVWKDVSLYPLIVGPNLGYTTQGGTFYNGGTPQVVSGYSVQAASNGTAGAIKCYTNASYQNRFKVSIYDGLQNANRLIAVFEETSPSTGLTSVDISSASLSIASGTSYFPAIGADENGHGWYYDAGSGSNQSYYNSVAYAALLPNPIGSYFGVTGNRGSIWVEYNEATGNGPATTIGF